MCFDSCPDFKHDTETCRHRVCPYDVEIEHTCSNCKHFSIEAHDVTACNVPGTIRLFLDGFGISAEQLIVEPTDICNLWEAS